MNRYYIIFLLVISTSVSHAQSCLQLFDSLPSREDFNRETIEKYDPDQKLDFREDNPGELRARVESVNELLLNGSLTEKELIERGIVEVIRDRDIEVTSKKGESVTYPFYEYKLNLIGTSLYVPKTEILPEHQMILLMLPGTGSNHSTAKTVIPAAQTLTKVSRKKKDLKPYLGDKYENEQAIIGFRAYTILMDPPGNAGKGKEAPDWYTTAEGNLLTLQHAHQVINALINQGHNLPLAMAGRSQGGLQSMSYAHVSGFNEGFIGGAGVNPSGSNYANVVTSAHLHEKLAEQPGGLEAILKGVGEVYIDHKMWYSYRKHTENYPIKGETEAMIGLFFSRFDDSYNMRYYEPWAREVVDSNQAAILVRAPDEWKADHDFWKKPASRLKQEEKETDAEFAARVEANENRQRLFEWSMQELVSFLVTAKIRYEQYLANNP